MEADFWHQRWQANQIGFHQEAFNRHLREQWHRLGLAPGTRVLVPLCGKSLDMLWLREQGHQVCGVELSPIAVEAFFNENQLAFELTEHDHSRHYQDTRLDLYCGDFFDIPADCYGKLDAVFDRAALVALPPPMRQRYAEHLAGLLAPGARMLLVTMEYDPAQMSGPPFAVTADEVRGLYAETFVIEELEEFDCLSAQPSLRERGLTQLNERIYLLTRR